MMPALLSTLGVSWAVVPEAFLLGNGADLYSSVTILTTDDEKTRTSLNLVQQWFRDHHPTTDIHALVIDGLADLSNSHDHRRFEEALYRTYFALLRRDPDIHICLAGGFKTMSAAAHEAAGLLGCHKLFHVSAPVGLKIDTHDQILDAIDNGKVNLIDLGSRVGWPTIRELDSAAPSLPPPDVPFSIEHTDLADQITARIEAASRLAANEAELATLPFPQIARWAPGDRAALEEQLDSDRDADWIKKLPKIELHCHLGGFATHGELLQQVRTAASHPDRLPPFSEDPLPPKWPLPPEPIDLPHYMELGNANGSTLLKDPGCLQQQCELLYQHLQSQNIIYAEIRCSPANYASDTRSPWTVLSEIKATFDRCMDSAKVCRVNLIIIATRRNQGDFRTDIGRHLSLAVTAAEHWNKKPGCHVVGVDLAGYEDETTRAHYFREDFNAAHRSGLGITIHAGENDDAEGIWSAILDLNTRRLGHALHLNDSPSLRKTVADRRIGIEMCPFANFQIKGYPLHDQAQSPNDPKTNNCYPLLAYLNAGVPVTVNTDNIGISAASLSDNFLLLPRLCPGITRLQILKLIRNSIDQAFLPSVEKNRLLSEMKIVHI